MRRETGVRCAVALLSVLALGVSATTIESSITTDANDVIDLDYDRLPIDPDDGSAMLAEIEGTDGDGEPLSEPASEGDPSSGGESDDGTGAASGGESTADAGGSQGQSQSESEAGGTTEPELPSLLDRLLALLAALLPVLLVLAALVATGALVVRYRDRLSALLGGPADDPAAPGTEATADWAARDPANPVDRAWAAMVRRLDLEGSATKTPAECARAAVDAGFDGDAVRTLTETFEEVRYGDRPVTEDRERAAERSRRRLDGGGDP